MRWLTPGGGGAGGRCEPAAAAPSPLRPRVECARSKPRPGGPVYRDLMSQPRALVPFLVLAACAATATAQNVLRVGPGGFPSVQAAVVAAASGDVIRIAAGFYQGDGLAIDNKSLTLIADPPGASILAVSGQPSHVNLQPGQRVH